MMTSRAFDALLLGPDNDASNLQLVDSIAADDFTGPGLPDIAHRCLDAFCKQSNSDGRRRWTGIALIRMMRASTSVVRELKKLSQGLPRLGAIITERKETEERKVIAGLIIQRGLEAGINFADFWESDKIGYSAPNFPKDAGEQWMGDFQTYLDTLGSLALASLSDEPLIMFPTSLYASDGFTWIGRSSVAIIQNKMLTMIASDPKLIKIQFIDIPISHVQSIRCRQVSQHESQEDQLGRRVCDIVLSMKPGTSTYRLDSSIRKAPEFVISFASLEDAEEFKAGILDAQKGPGYTKTAATEVADSTASTSPADRVSNSSEQNVDAAPLLGKPKDSLNGAGSDSGGTMTEPFPLDQRRGEQILTQHVPRNKGNGKLPRISKAMKQKASRGLKRKASTKVNPNLTTSEAEEETPSQDESQIKPKATAPTATGTGNGRNSRSRRKGNVEDDDDFVPAASKAKSKVLKRKRGSSVAEDLRPKKKSQVEPNEGIQVPTVKTTLKKQGTNAQNSGQNDSVQARKPMKQIPDQQNIQVAAPSRPSLIEGLLQSKNPNKASAPTFKKPDQPASTPGRPKSQIVKPVPKPQTPIEAHRELDHLPLYVASSTPRRHAVHDEDFGLQYDAVDAEILSSNTKRVPDSPHAESTAISGHADRDEVHLEKWKGDMETARNDPFQQRRQGQKATSFFRRLTGESAIDDRPDPVHRESMSMPDEIVNDDSEVKDLIGNSLGQLPPKQNKRQTQQSPIQVTETKSSPMTAQAPRKAATTTSQDALQPPRHEAAYDVHASLYKAMAYSQNRTQNEPTAHEKPKHFPAAAEGKGRHATVNMVDDRALINDSVVSGPREAIDDTLLGIPAQLLDEVGLEGDETLVDEEADMPNMYGAKASPIRFRSSPPIPDSSSIHGTTSDESEVESEPSPPTSRADELEWEAALQPHQRALHDQLLRTSKRVVRHIVDNETAVSDIAGVFANDGDHILNLLLERQSDESADAFQGLASKRQTLLKELSDASKNIKTQRRRVKTVD